MHRFLKLLICFVITNLMTSCFDAPDFLPKTPESQLVSKQGLGVEVSSDSIEEGVVEAKFNPSANVTQSVSVKDNSSITGTTTSFPPGSLNLSTTISVEEGTNISDVAIRENLGLTEDVEVKESGAPVVIRSSVAMDTAKPFTLSIPLPKSQLGLNENETDYYAVFFKAEFFNEKLTKDGVIPTNKLTIKDGFAYFQTQYFGAYQAVSVSQPITKAVTVTAKDPIVSKRVAKIEPMTIAAINKIAFSTDDLIVFTGENITPTIQLAFNDKVLAPLKEASDVSASFYLPNVPFGFQKAILKQNGVQEQMTLFALNDKTDFPLMTVEPAGICEGVKYYDASGTLRTGTKVCTSSTTTTTTSTSINNLDSDGNGAADLADAAITSGSASFAFGKKGDDIASATQIKIPSNGDYFNVTGNSTIHGIASTGRIGRRVLLYFTQPTRLKHNSTSLPMFLDGSIDYVAGAGDLFEFVELPNRWQEVMRKSSHYPAFYGYLDNTGQSVAKNSATPVEFDVIVKDTQNEYDSATGYFYPSKTGTYRIEAGIRFEISSLTNKAEVSFKVKNVETSSQISATYCSMYNSTLFNKTCEMTPTTLSLTRGKPIYFEFYAYDKNGVNSSFLVNTSSTYLKIIYQP